MYGSPWGRYISAEWLWYTERDRDRTGSVVSGKTGRARGE